MLKINDFVRHSPAMSCSFTKTFSCSNLNRDLIVYFDFCDGPFAEILNTTYPFF